MWGSVLTKRSCLTDEILGILLVVSMVKIIWVVAQNPAKRGVAELKEPLMLYRDTPGFARFRSST